MKNEIILEKKLDFRQFQNLIILTFVTFMTFLALTYTEEFEIPVWLKILLGLLTILFITILLTKKGLCIEANKLYVAIFLFGFIVKKQFVDVSSFEKLALNKGKLSTNYAYSYDITEFHNWEPDLNNSVTSFTLSMENQNNKKQKIIMLTKSDKVKLAIDFIQRNTKLSY